MFLQYILRIIENSPEAHDKSVYCQWYMLYFDGTLWYNS